jgi:hypothetical protein
MVLRVRRNPYLFLPAGLFSSILVQIHPTGTFFVFVMACFVAFSARLVSERETDAISPPPSRIFWALLGFVAFFATLTPYMSFLIPHFQETGLVEWAKDATHRFGAPEALRWLVFAATGSHFWGEMLSVSAWNWPVFMLPGALVDYCYILVIPFLLGLFKYTKSVFMFLKKRTPHTGGRIRPEDFFCPALIGLFFLVESFFAQTQRPHHYTIILPFLNLALSEGILRLLAIHRRPAAANPRGALSLFEAHPRSAVAVRVLLSAGLISCCLQYPFVISYVNANNGSTGEYGICYREQRRAAEKIARLADGARIGINGSSSLDGLFWHWREGQLQETIAYICRVEFGVKVLFNANPEPGAKELKLIKSGDKLHFELSD